MLRKQLRKLKKETKRDGNDEYKLSNGYDEIVFRWRNRLHKLWLGFPYEIEKRYRKMVREDREYAELIFDYLVEEGTNKYDDLSDTEFKRAK